MYRTELDEVILKHKKKTSLKNNTNYFPWLALLLVCVRVSGALLCPPLDCDETFNYWEPLHYLVYGWGLQTWEYSPEFALRSYVPLWALAAPMSTLAPALSPRHLYYLTRVLLACVHAAAEITLAAALKHAFHPEVGSVFLWLSGCGAGGWAMGGALLPSAWCAALGSAALACWVRARPRLSVALHVASALLSWPFAAAMALPLAHDILKGWRSAWRVAATGVAVGVLLCLVLAGVDSWAYGRAVLAPLNILLYNVHVRDQAGAHGPDLYGTEPAHFYFFNLLLNLNVAWLLALASPVALVRRWRWGWGARGAWLWAAAALWLAIFTLQPHKEERFMYPAYPALLALAALSAHALLPGRRARALALGAALALGGARTAALHFYYSAPMQLFHPLQTEGAGSAGEGVGVRWVCLGAHWHRVGGSFLLPARGYRLRFLPSAHAGQLPAPYLEHANGTRVVHEHFNSANVGDARTYLQLHECHYALLAEEERPSSSSSSSSRWEAVASAPLLVAERSPRAARALYLPLVSPALNSYTALHLLKNTALAQPTLL